MTGSSRRCFSAYARDAGRMLTVAAVAALLVSSAGCGGDGDTDRDVGSVAVRMFWPGVAVADDQRPRMVSLEVKIVELNRTALDRTDNPCTINLPETMVRFGDVPAGDYVIEVKGFSEPDAFGDLLGQAEIFAAVVKDRRVTLPVTFRRLIVQLEVQPSIIEERVTLRMVPTVRDGQNRAVMIPPQSSSPFTFTITEGPPGLTVDEEGRVTTPLVLGNIPLFGKLFTRHDDSGIRNELIIMIKPRIILP